MIIYQSFWIILSYLLLVIEERKPDDSKYSGHMCPDTLNHRRHRLKCPSGSNQIINYQPPLSRHQIRLMNLQSGRTVLKKVTLGDGLARKLSLFLASTSGSFI